MRRLIYIVPALLTLASALFLLGRIDTVGGIATLASLYIAVQLSAANTPMVANTRGFRTLLGFPWPLFLGYLGVLVLIIEIGGVYQPDLLPETNTNFLVFSLGGFFGWVAGLVDWYTIQK